MHDDLTRDLRNLNRLAKVMRQRRIDRGALTLASPEVKFEIDTETHDPLDVGTALSVSLHLNTTPLKVVLTPPRRQGSAHPGITGSEV
ncbi:unnamed protein product [Closterium sp. NIES-53]